MQLGRWFHALSFNQGKRDGPGKEPHQFSGRVGRPRRGAHTSGECYMELDFCGQGSNELDTGSCQNLSDDDHAKLDVPLRNKLGDDIGVRARHFVFDGFGHTETLEHASQVDAALPLLQIRNRPCIEEGALERFHRTDIRLGRPGADLDTDPGARKIDARIRDDHAFPDESIDLPGCRDQKIERFARLDPPNHANGDIRGDIEAVAGCALELWPDLVEDRRNGPRTEDLDLSRIQDARPAQED